MNTYFEREKIQVGKLKELINIMNITKPRKITITFIK